MSKAGRETFEHLVTDLLAEGPMTGFQIVRALEQQHHQPLRGREGSIYAVLLDLERGGLVESAEEPGEEGAVRRVYRLPLLVDVLAESGGEESR